MKKEWIQTDEEKQRKFQAKDDRRLKELKIALKYKEKPQTIHTLSLLNNDNTMLSQNDWCRLNNIIVSYERKVTFNQLPPLNHFESSTVKYQDVLNNELVIHCGVIAFFKQIPEFDQLIIGDQIKLIKYNLRLFMPLHFILLSNFITNPKIDEIMPKIHGMDLHRRIKNTLGKFRIFYHNPTVLKLILIIFIFNTSLFTPKTNHIQSNVENIHQLYRAQNYYTELLWHYMERTYGEYQAIIVYSLIITQCLNLQKLILERDQYLRATTDVNDLTPLMQSVLQTAFEDKH
ncbi:unnamed protein product [Didymodactylos carnosus]|uniref:Uncharacterized protein n=2 Tax=Didymodactylos carnosus TaxID=1234261 RepID=A0A8S2JES9_9BILA|nr:unnamed protein product [Didymodactylos carnosus]CAF3807798.1 unnamed protein product [Didymodactylos carnosus]